MRPEGFIPANFRIAPAAKQSIFALGKLVEAHVKEPVGAATVAWGLFAGQDGRRGEGVVVSYYTQAEMNEVLEKAVQHVDGVDLVFFTLPKHARHFEGKWIDFSEDRGFFLSDHGPA